MVKQKFNWLSQQRVDIPHIRSIEDGALFDFAVLWKIFQADTPYILNQFNVLNPASAINSPAGSIQIGVAGGIVTLPTDGNGSFLRVLPGTPPEQLSTANTKVTGSFTANSTNYVSVIFTRQTDNSTADLVSFWDVDSKTEFTRTVPTGLVLNYQFVINTVGFSTNAPLCIVTTNASNQVLTITNAKQSIFRLGTGGASPNPNYSYVYPITPENSITISSAGGSDPFRGGDWELGNFKAWMDAVMTSFKQLKGGAFWYANGSTLVSGVSVFTAWQDSNDSLITGAGRFIHSKVTPGLLTWTSDMFIKSITGDLYFRIPANNITLANEQVGYISLQRDVDFQPANMFTFTNGLTTVNAIGTVTGINPGDWIKPKAADISTWRKIITIVGTVITLDKGYTGPTAFDQAVKTVQDYNINIDDPVDVPADGGTYWIAKRDDFSFTTETIAASPTGAVRTSGVVTITVTAPTAVAAGQVVEIAGVTDTTFNGLWEVQTVVGSTFTYFQPGQPNATSGSGSVISQAKIYLRQMGELNQGESINIDDTVSNETLQFIGATSSSDNFPGYAKFIPGPLSYIADGESLTQAIALLDQQAGLGTNISKEDRNLKLVRGGTWNFADPVLSWSQDAYIQIPGLPEVRNRIPAGNVTLTSDGDVAYVEINRLAGSPANLTVSTSSISALTPTNNTVIIARKFGSGGISVGTQVGTFALTAPSQQITSGGIWYVTGNGLLSTYDISTPSAPSFLGSVAIPLAGAIELVGTTVYVGGGSGGAGFVKIVDVSTPATPTVLGTYNFAATESVADIKVIGTRAFVLFYTGIPIPTEVGDIRVIDVTTPASPTTLGTNTTYGGNLLGGNLAKGPAHIYKAGGNRVNIFDGTSNTAALLADYTTGFTEADQVAVSGGYLYIVDAPAKTLTIHSLSTPAAPALVGTLVLTHSSPYKINILGGQAYIRHSAGDFVTLVNVSVPASPTEAYTSTFVTSTFEIAPYGNVMFLLGTTTRIVQALALAGATSVLVGTHTFSLITGESKENEAGMSIQNRTYLGIPDEATASPAWNSGHSVPLRFIASDASSVTAALSTTNIELDKLFGQFRLRSSASPDVNVSITGSDVVMLTGETLSQVLSNLLTSFTGASINFQTGVVTGVPGTFSPVIPAAGMYRWFSIGMLPSSTTSDQRLNLQVLVIPASGDGSSLALAPKAPFSSDAFNLGQVAIHSTNGTTVDAIPMSYITQLGIGSGSGSGSSGSGVGDDLDALTYRASFRDQLKDLPSSASNAIDYSTAHTDPNTFSLVNHYFRLAYDASKTIAAGTTATSIILSAAASYTVKNGDIVRIGTEARKIVTTVNQFTFTVEGTGFSFTPTLAQQVTVSQAVYTQDINNFSGTGQPISASFADNINDVLVQYGDSITNNDIIPDWNFVPRIAFDASSNGAGNPTDVAVRVQGFETVQSITVIPSPGTNLYLRFFSNFTSGSGFVNLLNYRLFFHREPVADFLPQLEQSSGRTDGLGSSINCTVDNSGSFTIIGGLPTYSVGVNPGTIGGQLEVYLNGQKIPRFLDSTSTPAGSYQELDGNSIRLDSFYGSLDLEFEVLKRVGTIDVTDDNVTDIASLDELFHDRFQNSLDQDALLTPINAAPTPGQFRSDIQNRAPIPDLNNDLLPHMGVNRIPIQRIVSMPKESGPNGEEVFSVMNDQYGQIRLVGDWQQSYDYTAGPIIISVLANDYIEVVFLGTGLNLLYDQVNFTTDIRVSVDGGVETGNLNTAGGSASIILTGRSYNANVVLPVVKGLAYGQHTAKIRSNVNAGTIYLSGIEILTESSTIRVPTGSGFADGKKITHAVAESVSHNSGFESGSLGTKGGRVLLYLKPDGTVGKACTPVDATQHTLAATDHSNEEIIRTHYWREFSSGRTDDFGFLTTSNQNTFGILNDATTALVCAGGSFAGFAPFDAISIDDINDFIVITFVGSGLDWIRFESATGNDTIQYTLDGVSLSSAAEAGFGKIRNFKLASGLPYGTHTIRIIKITQANWSLYTLGYKVYGPKKPALPSGALELADYCVMANFVGNTLSGSTFAGTDGIGTGVLRKFGNREVSYVGANWVISSLNTVQPGGHDAETPVAGQYAEFTFFGTGFVRNLPNPDNAVVQINLNGVAANTTNYPGLTSSTFGSVTFVPSTGVMTDTSGSNNSGVNISGLPLAEYTIRFTNTNGGGNGMHIGSIDVITPIHSQKFNQRGALQNTLPIGSQGLRDERKLSVHENLPENKNWAEAKGTVSNTGMGSFGVPVPILDMFVTVHSKGGLFEVHSTCSFLTNSTGTVASILYVDNKQAGHYTVGQSFTSGGEFNNANKNLIYLPKGEHTVGVYWLIGGGASSMTAIDLHRTLTVKED